MGRPRPAVIVEIIPVEDAPMRSPSDPDASGRGARLDGSGTWGGSGGSPDAGSGTSRGGGGPTPDGRDDRRCGPARMALVGAGAVVSLIAVVALVTGGANDHRDAAPAPPVPTTAPAVTPAPGSTTATSTTVALNREAVGGAAERDTASTAPVAPLYLPDLPAEYLLIAADQTYPYRGAPRPGLSQLWADGPLGAPPRRWMRVDAIGAADAVGVNGTWGSARVQTANGVALMSQNEYGGVTLSGPIAGGAATITTSALTAAQSRAAMDGAAFVDDTVRFDDQALPPDFRLFATSEPSAGAQGVTNHPFDLATMTLTYQSAVDPAVTLSIGSTLGQTPFDRIWDHYTVPFHTDHSLSPWRSMTVRSTAASGPGWSWIDVMVGDATFRISGTAPRSVALAAARTLGPVGGREWGPLQRQAAANRHAHPVAWYTAYHEVASGSVTSSGVAAGSNWSVLSARGAEIQPDSYLVTIDGDSGGLVEQSPTAQVRAVANATTTVVLASAPGDWAGARLRVTVGATVRVTPLNNAGDGSGNVFGAIAFTDVGVPSAQVLAANGTLIATLPFGSST